MKKVVMTRRCVWVALLAQLFMPFASAQVREIDPPLAERGGAVIFLSDVDSLIMGLPERIRGGYLDDPDRIQTTLSNLLLERQTAALIGQFDSQRDAEADRNTARDFRKDKELANAVRDHYIEEVRSNLPEFGGLALEFYLANKQLYHVKESWTFRHVLVKENGRTSDDARARAEEARQLLLEGALPEDQIVKEYTDEQVDGQSTSDGYLKEVRPEMMVPEFRAAFSLNVPGQVSEVMKTVYGFHVVKLLSRSDSRQLTFEEARSSILEMLRDKHIRNRTSGFDDNLRNQPTRADPDLIMSLRTRYRDAARGIIAPVVPHVGLVDPASNSAPSP